MDSAFRSALAGFIWLGTVFSSVEAVAERSLTAERTSVPPVLDGEVDDAWLKTTPVEVTDGVANIPITLRALYDSASVYLLATFPDAEPNRFHRRMHWDKETLSYREGPEREDTLVLKWNLSPYEVDLTLKSELDYRADVWFWKANRTAPSGYADDKYQIYTSSPGFRGATLLQSRSGKVHYLVRKGDSGQAAYKGLFHTSYKGDQQPRFEAVEPSGSRADIRAGARWDAGQWVIEMQRALRTDDAMNDVQFSLDGGYLLGVSRFEVAGRALDPTLDQPLYGAGDVGELIRLTFRQ